MTASPPKKTVAELFGQPPPAQTGRERLVAAGIELFARFGYNSVSLDRVIDHAGITKTTFYKHFESKEHLVLECVRARHEWESQAWLRATRDLGGADPRRQLLAFLDVLDIWFNDPDFRGCHFINAAAEFSDRRDPVHQVAAVHKRAVRDHFRELAAQAGARDPDEFADQYTILIEGTMVLRHVHDRDDAARVVRPAAERLVQEHMPRSPANRLA